MFNRTRSTRGMGMLMVLLIACGLMLLLIGLSQCTSADQSGASSDEYTATLSQAAETGKPVVLVFTAAWCPPCQIMKKRVWPDPQVQQLIAGKYHKVVIDVDLPETRHISDQFGVQYLPTIVILDAAGNERKRANTMDVEQLLAFLNS